MEPNPPPGSGASRAWYLLLLLPFVAVLLVPTYNRVDPEWGGIPFYYVYQLLWILIGAVLTLIVYLVAPR